MSSIVKFEELEGKLISYHNKFILVDNDMANLHGVETKDINKTAKTILENF